MSGGAVLLAFAAAAAWLARAWLWPYAKCRRCGGSGRNGGSTSRRFGNCRRCDGSGRRMVTGSKAVHRALKGARDRKGKR